MAHEWLLFFTLFRLFHWKSGFNDENKNYVLLSFFQYIKNKLCLLKANGGHDETNLCCCLCGVSSWAKERDEAGSLILKCLYLPYEKILIWDANSAVTLRGLAAAFAIKQKRLSEHLQVFLTFPSTPCFFLSCSFYSIATLPGGERNQPWTVGREEEEEVKTRWA